MSMNRRVFFRDAVRASAGLAIAFRMPTLGRMEDTPGIFEPNAYIRIGPDNTITLWVTRSEMGQGVRTNLPAALAEELEVDLAKVRVEQAIPGTRFKGIRLRTSGSGSSSGTFWALRKAGASAREMLISAAAEEWSVDRATCRAENAEVIDDASGRKRTYGELAARAARQAVPKDPPLKKPSEFKLIGKPLKRLDGPAIVHGQAIYGFDARPPGALVAMMERCPHLGGKLISFDGTKALAIPGVRHVVPVKNGIYGGVAVVAENTWAAMKGREALQIKWDAGANANFDSDEFIRSMAASLDQPGFPIRRVGDTEKDRVEASKRMEAVYEFPFQAHAPLETMNCTADVGSDRCEVWVPTQTPDTALENVTKFLGFSPDVVKIHTTLVGGGFGRRLIVDYVDEAVELSKSIRKPVQLVWSRTDDMRSGFYHPASIERISATIANGSIASWVHKSVGQDLTVIHFPSAEDKKDLQFYAKNELPWGAFDNPYNLPVMKVDFVPVESPVPTGPWRSVFYPSRAFARESFMDEIARSLGKDPLELRIELLAPGDVLKLGNQEIDRKRMIRVLEATREKSAWMKPIAPQTGRFVGRGLAMNIYQGETYMTQVAEVSVANDLSDLRVDRMVCVFDCGFPINPAGLEGQAESGITWGLSATLHGKMDFRNGRAVQGNYNDFAVMRMGEMPALEIHILPSSEAPGGFGEHSVVPVAPAVANAIFAATGRRMRQLPIAPHDLAR